MNRKDVTQVINTIRISNPFTMGLEFAEYVEQFKERWEKTFGEKLETIEDVAAAILKIKE